MDPVSLIAAWCEPLRTALEQGFEDTFFPPAEWQALSHGQGWYRTDDGSGGNWTVPPWDSFYAVTKDEFYGCCDYLITPLMYGQTYMASVAARYMSGLSDNLNQADNKNAAALCS